MRGVAPGSLSADRTDPPPPPPPPAMPSTRPALTHRRRRRLSCSASPLASQRACQDTNRDATNRCAEHTRWGESTGQATKKITKGSDANFGTQIRNHSYSASNSCVWHWTEGAVWRAWNSFLFLPAGRPALGWLVQSYEVRDALKHGPLCIALAQACRANGQTCRLHTTPHLQPVRSRGTTKLIYRNVNMHELIAAIAMPAGSSWLRQQHKPQGEQVFKTSKKSSSHR